MDRIEKEKSQNPDLFPSRVYLARKERKGRGGRRESGRKLKTTPWREVAGARSERNGGESDLADHVTATPRCNWIHTYTSKIDVPKKRFEKKKKKKKREKERKKKTTTHWQQYIHIHTHIYTSYTDSVKKHEVVPVVVISRWWETEGGQGGGYVCFRGWTVW